MASTIIETRNFEWKIHNFTEEIIKGFTTKKKLYTNNFEIILGENITKWKFGCSFSEETFSFLIQKQESFYDDFFLQFEVYVRTLDGESKFRHSFDRDSDEFDTSASSGHLNLFKVDKIFESLNDFLVDDTLTLVASMKLIQTKEFDDSDVSSCGSDCRYQPIFEEFFESKRFSDFKFVCSDGILIPAHRLILAAFSPVMKRMLETDMIEAISGTANLVDIDGETMTEVLRYIYIREVDKIEELAPKLLHAAKKYELDHLEELCITSMMEHLTKENAIECFLLADQYDLKGLLEFAAKFIKSNYKELSEEGTDWDKLSRQHLMMLLKYQQSPEHIQIFESTL